MTSFIDYIADNILKPSTWPGAIFYAVLVIAAAWIVGRAIRIAIDRYLDRAAASGIDSTPVRFLGQLGKVAVYTFALLSYAHLIPALQPLGTAWLASVGVVSVVVGLAVQSTLSNLVAGISLVLYHPFRIGDRIQVAAPAGPEIGTVESVDLGYTMIRTVEGKRLVLPNSIIANQASINLSHSFIHAPCEISCTLRDSGAVEYARQIFLDTAKGIPKLIKINGCFVTGVSGQGVVLMLSAVCADAGDVAQAKSDLLENAKKKFDEAGIKLV